MSKHPKMMVGNLIDSDFTVEFDPCVSSGSEVRKIFKIKGYDDYAIGLHDFNEDDDQHFYIETVVSSEAYEAIPGNEFLYNGFATMMRLARGEAA